MKRFIIRRKSAFTSTQEDITAVNKADYNFNEGQVLKTKLSSFVFCAI